MYLKHHEKDPDPNRRHTCMRCGMKRFEKDMELVAIYAHGGRFVCKECPTRPKNTEAP